MDKEWLETVRRASPVERVATEAGVQLRRKGRQLVGLCPLHGEKTPSFFVTPGKGLWHCFGCNEGGDVFAFVTSTQKVEFVEAVELLALRAGLSRGASTAVRATRTVERRTRAVARDAAPAARERTAEASVPAAVSPQVLARVVEHYHRTFCEREDAQAYLQKRGLTDPDLLRALKVGYADGSLLKLVPSGGELREQLLALGVITAEGRELLGGCVVVPIPDAVTGEWVSLYGRGVKTARHCYLPGPMRGVLNFQAARSSDEVVLAESVLDALSFHQAGIATAIPIYGTNGFTADHLDLIKREGVRRVILALDSDEPGRKATDALKEKLGALGLVVRVASYPAGVKDANDLLVSRNGDAGEAFRALLDAAEPRPPVMSEPEPPSTPPLAPQPRTAEKDQIHLERDGLVYAARPYPVALGRLRATVRVSRGQAFHVDTLDLYASRSRTEFSRRAAKVVHAEEDAIESHLLALLIEAEERQPTASTDDEGKPPVPEMTSAEKAEALALLRRPDLLDQAARDIDALGYVGEEMNTRLLYLVSISRKLPDPLSALILSQSGAGKSGITEVIERMTPPEDVVLLTRLTPQSLYYVPPGFLDQKLVIVEERHGSMEADYSIRVLQSRKKLIAAAPVKDPATGSLRTKVFTVEARAAFIEATTATSVNHENATRCFELAMDESVEQTRKIHERQRLMKTEAGLGLRQEAEAICRRHWNAQRLLDPAPVVIPFADRLSFPVAWMRTRRDHARFLNLIEVSAFLHQHQRTRKGGAIVATVADYAAAHRLAGAVLAETFTDVKRPLREAYERVRALCAAEGTVCRRQVREALQLPDSTVRRWLSELVELEYLAVVEASKGGAGKSARYRVVERAPDAGPSLGLLTPAELEALCRRSA